MNNNKISENLGKCEYGREHPSISCGCGNYTAYFIILDEYRDYSEVSE